MAKKVKDPNKKTIWQEFKEFISRGNVLDMAVGVIIGGAFSAIVTALVNILMSLATWAVPGGINGLVSVLPALNPVQEGMNSALVITDANGVQDSLGQFFKAGNLQALATELANQTYGETVVNANPNLIESIKSTILSKYTLHGTTYTYNLSAVINWGAFINAVISFLIIALTLFIVVKVANSLTAMRNQAKAKIEATVAAKQEEKAEEEVAE